MQPDVVNKEIKFKKCIYCLQILPVMLYKIVWIENSIFPYLQDLVWFNAKLCSYFSRILCHISFIFQYNFMKLWNIIELGSSDRLLKKKSFSQHILFRGNYQKVFSHLKHETCKYFYIILLNNAYPVFLLTLYSVHSSTIHINSDLICMNLKNVREV